MKSSYTKKLKRRFYIDLFMSVCFLAYVIYFLFECANGEFYSFTKYGQSGFIRLSEDPTKFYWAVIIKSSFCIFVLGLLFKGLAARAKSLFFIDK